MARRSRNVSDYDQAWIDTNGGGLGDQPGALRQEQTGSGQSSFTAYRLGPRPSKLRGSKGGSSLSPTTSLTVSSAKDISIGILL